MRLLSVENDNIEVIFNRMYINPQDACLGALVIPPLLQSQSHFTILSYIFCPEHRRNSSTNPQCPLATNLHKYYFKLSLFKIGNKEENYYKGAHIISSFMLRYIPFIKDECKPIS